MALGCQRFLYLKCTLIGYSMSEEVRYRLYEKGDESEIVELLTEVFGQWPQIDVNCSPLEY